MDSFYANINWVILCPPGSPAAKRACEDLASAIKLMAGKDEAPSVINAEEAGLPDTVPVIILNNESGSPEGRRFSWRAGKERVEIFGQSEGGLCRGIYDFISALEVSWPAPENTDEPVIKNITAEKIYPLKYASNSKDFETPQNGGSIRPEALWKRLVIPENLRDLKLPKKRTAIFRWAVRNGFDAIVLPFHYLATAGEVSSLGLVPEAGGWTLSRLVPRKLFFMHRDFFRMEGGKRLGKTHFCPTNPETIAVLKTEGKKLFSSASAARIFHLWPDMGEEKTWCSCPTCRAFTLAEQNRIAVNAAADALAEVNAGAVLSYYEETDDEPGIPLRQNIIKINISDVKIFPGSHKPNS